MTFFAFENWQLLYSSAIADAVRLVPLSLISANTLLLKATYGGASVTWTKAGEVTQLIDSPGLGQFYLQKKYELLWLNALSPIKLVNLNDFTGYGLRIEKAKWIPELNLQIYQAIEDMPQIYNEPVAAVNNAATAIASSTVAAATTSTQILAANTNRKWVKIINTSTTADLCIDYDGAASLVDYSEKILRGGNNALIIDGTEWRGAIHGIWTAASGAAMVREAT